MSTKARKRKRPEAARASRRAPGVPGTDGSGISPPRGVGGRLEHVDAMRGLAVVFMLWMHTGDGWLAPELRFGPAFEWVRLLGGLAAPVFLLLAGVSLGIGRARARSEGALRGELARALQLVVLGYLLRVQMWLVDGAGYASGVGWVAAVALAGGYLATYQALSLGATGSAPRAATRFAALGAFGVCGGLAIVALAFPGRLEGLLRQDVLQAIGASLAVVALVTRLRPGAGPAVAAGVVAALLTHPLRALMPGELPHAVAGYIAYFDPGPDKTPAGLFPLFPWLAYPFFGYAVGLRWGGLPAARIAPSTLAFGATGALLALATWELHPHIRVLMQTAPWLVQPLRVAYRLGLGLSLGALCLPLAHAHWPLRRPLLSLGRASLCVYWVHLPFAFGVLGRPLHRRLSFLEWGLGLAALAVAMVLVAELWLGRKRWGGRRERTRSAPTRAVSPSR